MAFYNISAKEMTTFLLCSKSFGETYPMIAVVETTNGRVSQVILRSDQHGAEIIAKQLCHDNGIEFEGDESCDGSIRSYSVQIATCTSEPE